MEKRNALPLPTSSSLRPRSSGFHAPSRTFQSLRPSVPLPPVERRLNVAAYAFSLLPSPLPAPRQPRPRRRRHRRHRQLSRAALTDPIPRLRPPLARWHRQGPLRVRPRPDEPRHSPALPRSPLHRRRRLRRQPCLHSARDRPPPFPLQPCVAFATAAKLSAGLATIILDSPRFRSFLDGDGGEAVEEVAQSDVAFLQFSSGTTGMMKAAALSHRNTIAIVAASHSMRNPMAEGRRGGPEGTLLGAPLFHSMGLTFLLKGLARETTVLIGGRAGVKEMVQAAPPVVVEMSRWLDPLDLVALEYVTCGGAPLPEAAAVRFMKRFPHVELRQRCGSTEAGPISGMIGQEECRRLRSVGRLAHNVEAMLVDTTTGERLSVGLDWRAMA